MVTNVILEIKDQLQIYALKIKIKDFFESLGESGLDSTFVNEASSTRSSPKQSSSPVVKLIDQTQVLAMYLPPIHTQVIGDSASF